MDENNTKKPFPIHKDTPAFFCIECGAVSLLASNICKPHGRGTKADWCGIKHAARPDKCHNHVNNLRYRCKKCGQASVTLELLCDPEKME